MRKIIFLIMFFFCWMNCSAQWKYDNNWTFGDSVGINFNNITNPSVFFTNGYLNEACATISDRNGDLLFYNVNQDGTGPGWGKLMNKYHEVIENGDSLHFFFSATNGAVFLPKPGDTSLFYFFYIDGYATTYLNDFLYYAIINKDANANHGKVLSKNIMISDSITERICCVRHGNGRDWWIITQKMFSNIFIKYLLDTAGIHGPFFQSIGSINNSSCEMGEISASSDGDKMIVVSVAGNVDFYSFNRCDGNLSNYIELGTPPYVWNPAQWNQYGAEFSSDGHRFYVSKVVWGAGNVHSTLTQYSINSGSITSVNIIDSMNSRHFAQMQLAPDGKIYLAQSPYACDSCSRHLAVIANPNDSAFACNFNFTGIYLNGHKSSPGLPNMPHFNLSVLVDSPCDTLGLSVIENSTESTLKIYPNPATTELTIESKQLAGATILITDIFGRELYRVKPNHNSEIINLNSFPSGIYFIQIKTNKGVEVRKFVKE